VALDYLFTARPKYLGDDELQHATPPARFTAVFVEAIHGDLHEFPLRRAPLTRWEKASSPGTEILDAQRRASLSPGRARAM